TAPSQMPEESPRGARRSRPRCQWLKSPMTETALAFGAQTAKCVPWVESPCVAGWAPSFSYARKKVPSREWRMSCSVNHTPGSLAGPRGIFASCWSMGVCQARRAEFPGVLYRGPHEIALLDGRGELLKLGKP